MNNWWSGKSASDELKTQNNEWRECMLFALGIIGGNCDLMAVLSKSTPLFIFYSRTNSTQWWWWNNILLGHWLGDTLPHGGSFLVKMLCFLRYTSNRKTVHHIECSHSPLFLWNPQPTRNQVLSKAVVRKQHEIKLRVFESDQRGCVMKERRISIFPFCFQNTVSHQQVHRAT